VFENRNEKDQELTCKDCGNFFIFTEREQQFFAEKGFTPPKRCKACRIKKKASFEAQQKRQP